MKLKLLKGLLLSTCLCASSFASDTWEYKDWETSIVGDNFVRYITHGSAVWGHEFGFIRSIGQCDAPESLWLTFSTYEDDLNGLEGGTLEATFTVDEQAFQMKLPVLGVQKFTPTMSIAFFTNIAVPSALRQALMNGNEVSVEFVAPQPLVAKFDIPMDTFSLSGITANSTKALDVCQTGPATLSVPPRVTKQELQQAAIQTLQAKRRIPNVPQNLIADQTSCIDPSSYEFVSSITPKMRSNAPTAFFGNYSVSADGRDGSAPYPPITIKNQCHPNSELSVLEVPGTEQQVFKLIVNDGFIYALSNNHSVGGLYDIEQPGVILQVIDIRDLEKAIVVGEMIFDGLVPEMTVSGSTVYITENDWLKVIDVSNPTQPTTIKEHKVDRGEFGTQGIASTGTDLLITSDRKVQAIHPQSGTVQWTLPLVDRPSDIFVAEGYAYVRTNSPSERGAKLLKLSGLKEKPEIVNTLRFAAPLYYLYQHGQFLLDGNRAFAIELGEHDTFITADQAD